jgi:hypothetical protein
VHVSKGEPLWEKALGRKNAVPNDQPRHLVDRTNSGMNLKLPAVTGAQSRPIRFFMTTGQFGDQTGAAV